MTEEPNDDSIKASSCYPAHLAMLTVDRNAFAVAWWTPLSRKPFRMVFAVDRENYSLQLIRERREVAFHLFDFEHAAPLWKSGQLSGRDVDKLTVLGLSYQPASLLRSAVLFDAAALALEMEIEDELEYGPADHVPFVALVVAQHERRRVGRGRPILFMGGNELATVGERRRFRPPGRARPRRGKAGRRLGRELHSACR